MQPDPWQDFLAASLALARSLAIRAFTLHAAIGAALILALALVYRFVKAGTADGEIERPSLALAREYLGYLNFLTWPYRGYQWAKYFFQKTDTPKKPPPKRKQPATVKVVTWHFPFTGSWILLLCLLIGGGLILFAIFHAVTTNPPPPEIYAEAIPKIIIAVLFGLALVLGGIWYYLNDVRWVKYEKAIPQARTADDPPPTAEETAKARNQLRLAIAYYHEIFEEKDLHAQRHKLEQATMALATARSLDPAITAVDTSQKEPFTYTIDQLASELLYFESLAYKNEADAKYDAACTEGLQSYLRNDYLKQHKEHLKKARDAAEKALRYNPDSSLYLRQAIITYRLLQEKKKAEQLLDHALSLYPDDIELLKLQATQ